MAEVRNHYVDACSEIERWNKCSPIVVLAAMRKMIAVAMIVVPVTFALAQVPASPPQERFEVVAIRPSNAADKTNRLGPTPQGGLRGENVTVLQLIAQALGVRGFQIVDAPEWASSERFDIMATPDLPEPAGVQQDAFRDRVRQRLHALLIDRFGLISRTEIRPMPVYKLVVAKSGHKMVPATAQDGRRMESNSTMLRGIGMDMKAVSDVLAGILLRPVVDETRLSGLFSFDMQFADVRIQTEPAAARVPTIFTAITEQMRLSLESARAPSAVVVIERVQRPSEN